MNEDRNSKKISIALITYHYGYNEGTMLQVYATARLLRNKISNCTVEVIDARHPEKEKIAFPKARNARERSLRSFFEAHLENKENIIRSKSPKKVFKKISRNYDLVVVGSDEVWRLDYKITKLFGITRYKQTNPWAPPFPNIYWPNANKLGVKCVTMASSISEMNNIELIPKAHLEEIRASLSAFSLISVRDTRSHDFIESVLRDVQAHWLPDPTFSLPNATKEQISDLQKKLELDSIESRQKIALVNCHGTVDSLHNVIESCKKNGYLVVGMSHPVKHADVNLFDIALDPVEWSTLPALADLLITDRFHGAVFALKNNVPVIALDHRNQASGSDSKIKDLFKRFGILQYWFPVENAIVPDGHKLIECLDNIICSWPAESIEKTCENFSAILNEFVDGPVSELITK
jgi:polysaccharide pyruvyl transferase WcaK-like protein